MMSGSDGRSDNWAWIMYQDSMPSYTFYYLSHLGVPVFVSPLHDHDLWTVEDLLNFPIVSEDDAPHVGELKKPHYHFMIMFCTNQSMAAVLRLLSPLHVSYVLQLGKCEKSIGQGKRAYSRYLCHLDNPEKAQYDPKDVLSFGGANYYRVSAQSDSASRSWDCAPIFAFILDHCIKSYAVLLDYCAREKREWYPLVFQHSRKFIEFMQSYSWSTKFIASHPDTPLACLPPGSPASTTTLTQGSGVKSFSSNLDGGVLSYENLTSPSCISVPVE